MQHTKPITAEEYLKARGLKNPPIDSGISAATCLLPPRVRPSMMMEEYATLKTQQLTDRINSLENSLTICGNSRNWNKDKVQQLTAENERLREAFEKLLERYVDSSFGYYERNEAIKHWRKQAGINLTKD